MRFFVGAGLRKIVKCPLGRFDDVACNKRRAFPRSLLAALYTTLPLQHGPPIEVVLCQLRKNAAKIHLAVAQRPESACALYPRLVAAINTLAARGMKLRILHVKHFHSRMINVEKCEVIELLQNKMAGIKQNVAPFVPAHAVEERVERHAVVKVLTRM